MKSKAVWALVALNVLLLAGLIGQWLKPNAAIAQAAGAGPSDYIMIPASLQGSPAQAVFIIDERNALLSARTFNGRGFTDIKPIPLGRILSEGGNPNGPNNPPRRGTGRGGM